MTEGRTNKTLVADAGVLFSAIAYGGLESKVAWSGRFKFMITRAVMEELLKALDDAGVPREGALQKLHDASLEVVEDRRFEHGMQEAFELIGARDPSDTPTVALALTVPNDGIWASDKDFQAVEGALKVWSSRELLDELVMKSGDET